MFVNIPSLITATQHDTYRNSSKTGVELPLGKWSADLAT
jgi:hypothetical protein